jgi:hypothetical protein
LSVVLFFVFCFCFLTAHSPQTSVDASGRNVHKSTIGTAVTIYRTEGLRSFMKGAAARVLWIAPGMAITIAVYEQSKRFLQLRCGLPAP